MKKTKKANLPTEQDRIQQLLRDERQKFINTPTRFFQIGEQVKYGNMVNATVRDILDDGKIYILDVEYINNNYGNPVKCKDFRVSLWTHILPFRTVEENNQIQDLHETAEMSFNASHRDIESLIHTHYSFGIDFSPDYQRGNVWNLDDKISLIDSIMKNLDIGKITLIHLPFKMNRPSYEILDGKQRLQALIEYFEDRFEFNGKKYSDLSFSDRRHFDRFLITVSEAKTITQKQKYLYFLRLNVRGKPVDLAHLQYVQNLLETT